MQTCSLCDVFLNPRLIESVIVESNQNYKICDILSALSRSIRVANTSKVANTLTQVLISTLLISKIFDKIRTRNSVAVLIEF
jgi:hypothetical protein